MTLSQGDGHSSSRSDAPVAKSVEPNASAGPAGIANMPTLVDAIVPSNMPMLDNCTNDGAAREGPAAIRPTDVRRLASRPCGEKRQTYRRPRRESDQ